MSEFFYYKFNDNQVNLMIRRYVPILSVFNDRQMHREFHGIPLSGHQYRGANWEEDDELNGSTETR